ncbi:hypothetical protein ACHQM5_009875 [Ranunculus cassubicifolius]
MEGKEAPPRFELNCTKCFDELWFCYSPFHQMQQYYRNGLLDNCSGKWHALVDCLNLKTKPSSQVQILEDRERRKYHIWSFRTREEATDYWRQLYGHEDDME